MTDYRFMSTLEIPFEFLESVAEPLPNDSYILIE